MKAIQYTIRGVHPLLDKEIRGYARRSGRSINVIAMEAMRVGLGLSSYDLEQADQPSKLGGLQAFDAATKKSATSKPKQSIKQQYHESITKKYAA